MVDLTRRARMVRELEQEFVPDYDAQSMPSADKRAAYALEHSPFASAGLNKYWPGSLPRSRPRFRPSLNNPDCISGTE